MPPTDKKKKPRKPGSWGASDVLMGIFGLAALMALAVAAFRTAKWLRVYLADYWPF